MNMKTETALVTTSPDVSSADIFFDRPNVVTDWDNIRALVEDGTYKKEDALKWIKEMEPLQEEDHREHKHWVNQQILRLCLLKEAGKPFDSKHTCDCCGSRKGDILFGKDDQYYHYCLPCKEQERQNYEGGSRGSCEFIVPRYNPLSHSWGLLYYWSHNSNTFIFWLADFYKTRQAAQAALQPVKHFIDWLNRKNNGLISHYLRFSSVLDLDDIMQMKLPLTPEQFRETLRSKIETQMAQDQCLLGYYVRDALREHARSEHDE